MRSALWQLGCVPQGAVRSPGGGGIHYAGTVPMGEGMKRCDAAGRSNLLPNVYVADGAAFPEPAQQVDHDVARGARDARGQVGSAVRAVDIGRARSMTELLFPLWQIDRREYDAVCAHLGR